ncbi:hypothetical protein [Salinicola endophyticus]|uniref:Type III secretion protein n=1 Tax=Salinicola endophyticus TaxID=1949083 RepID=A0AB74UDE3_9GAMM
MTTCSQGSNGRGRRATAYPRLALLGQRRPMLGVALALPSVALLIVTLLVAAPVRAAEAPWAGRDFRYVVIQQDVREVLKEFGRNLSLPVAMSDAVTGEVNGDIDATRAGDFLRQVCAANGLAWFYDGYVLHVATRGELSQRLFDLDGVDRERLLAALARSEIGAPLDATLIDDGARLEVSGPPAWITSVAQRLEGLRRPAPPAAPSGGVKIYRGSVATPPATSK